MSVEWYRTNRVVNLRAWHTNVRIDAVSLEGYLAFHDIHPKWKSQENGYILDTYRGRIYEWWEFDFYYLKDYGSTKLLAYREGWSELPWANDFVVDLLLVMSDSQVEGDELFKGLQAVLGDKVKGFKLRRCYIGGWLVYDLRTVDAVTAYIDGFKVHEEVELDPEGNVPKRGHLEALLKLIQAGA